MEGGCFCGAVRFSVEGQPRARTRCHCRSCRRASGGASVAWATFPDRALAALAGETKRYSSSPGVHWCFCAACGSLLFYRHDRRPGETDITTVSLDDAEAFPPAAEIWTEHMLGWEQLDGRLPAYARTSAPE